MSKDSSAAAAEARVHAAASNAKSREKESGGTARFDVDKHKNR